MSASSSSSSASSQKVSAVSFRPLKIALAMFVATYFVVGGSLKLISAQTDRWLQQQQQQQSPPPPPPCSQASSGAAATEEDTTR